MICLKNKVTRFLVTSLVTLMLLCLVIFSIMVIHMDKKNFETTFLELGDGIGISVKRGE